MRARHTGRMANTLAHSHAIARRADRPLGARRHRLREVDAFAGSALSCIAATWAERKIVREPRSCCTPTGLARHVLFGSPKPMAPMQLRRWPTARIGWHATSVALASRPLTRSPSNSGSRRQRSATRARSCWCRNISAPTSRASLYEGFPLRDVFVELFEWHYTPKRGSGLGISQKRNFSVLSRQCLDQRDPQQAGSDRGSQTSYGRRKIATTTTRGQTGNSPLPMRTSS